MKKLIYFLFFFLSSLVVPKSWDYEGHYPVLLEPWYFKKPAGIFATSNGNFYISGLKRIFMLNSQGHILRVYEPPPFYENTNEFKAIAVDSFGNMYVVNYFLFANNPVYVLIKYDSNGNYVKHIGGDIQDLYIDETNNLFVLYADRVVKMDCEFNELLSFGSYGENPGLFKIASGIWVDQIGKIYVVDASLSRVQIFDSSGQFQFMFGEKGSGSGQMNWPSDVCTDVNGNIYVADTINYRIQKYDKNGVFVFSWGFEGNAEGQFKGVGRIFIKNHIIYTLDTTLNRVQLFDLNGNYLSAWAPNGTATGMLMEAYDIDVDNSGNIYISDTGKNRIQKFDKRWNLDFAIGSSGTSPGQFIKPFAIAVDDEENIFVLDKGNLRVQKFDKKGNFLTLWDGSNPLSPYLFSDPYDLAVDKDGYVYVFNRDRAIVQKFTNDGSFIKEYQLLYEGTNLRDVLSLAIDNQKRLYALNINPPEIYVYENDGTYIKNLYLHPYISRARDIDIDNQGRIFIAELWPGKGATFSSDGTYLGSFGGGNDLIKDVCGSVGIAVSPLGKVYILEGNRVLFYRPH